MNSSQMFLKRHKSNEEPSVSEPGELLFIMGRIRNGRWGVQWVDGGAIEEE